MVNTAKGWVWSGRIDSFASEHIGISKWHQMNTNLELMWKNLTWWTGVISDRDDHQTKWMNYQAKDDRWLFIYSILFFYFLLLFGRISTTVLYVQRHIISIWCHILDRRVASGVSTLTQRQPVYFCSIAVSIWHSNSIPLFLFVFILW